MTIIAYGVTWAMARFVRIMDEPNHRSSHVKAVPRAGGVSIVITFYIGVAITWLLGEFEGVDNGLLAGFLFATFIVAAISLIDDITDQSALVKLVTQMIAVGIVLSMGIYLDELALPGFSYVDLGWIGVVISFFWILGLTNAYNFMDGLDGLAGGVAAIAGLFFLIITYLQGSSFVYIISYSLLAGALGFLFLNFPPAKIILGDVGAAFIGFVFAVLAIIATRFDESRTSFFVIPMLMFNFIYDTSFTLVKRWLQGKNVLEAHREHLYQLMNRSGFSHMEVVLVQYCMVFMQGLGAMWMVQIPGDQRILVFVPFLIFQIAYSLQIRKVAAKTGVQF
ncbi:MAG: undecaprenyl/decaprenyl-phosphate alpha-N-acetylglucosaminyl 1-phosphate transferase [Pseudomonadales bacterium]|nr:undecaprenyl/decaprenyl-phosphate alpha-N-acetylglucosaminyl 1-phosphate transferase [Pseudomonadales bacterium]MBO6595986.1 undecaprenyl/decaprenyl-phosphate alpha-N-acetylglucosaminyl 1-phosphate transferase [Pseudomonadales bacterium]MBO6822469.1 undecaprenyl/decaprenyl-phosphate alpha-N-acetylglucosaminyl 1-phosphate transferase [Pseudomonadales bacterium]